MDNWNSNCEPDGTVMSITDLSVLLKKLSNSMSREIFEVLCKIRKIEILDWCIVNFKNLNKGKFTNSKYHAKF